MCNTSQCKLRSLRVNSGMFNVICIVTYYTLPPLESPDSFWIAMAFSRKRPINTILHGVKAVRSHSMEAFRPPAAVSFTTGNTAEQWRHWEKQFAFYFAAAELKKKATKTHVAIYYFTLQAPKHKISTQTLFLRTLAMIETQLGSTS